MENNIGMEKNNVEHLLTDTAAHRYCRSPGLPPTKEHTYWHHQDFLKLQPQEAVQQRVKEGQFKHVKKCNSKSKTYLLVLPGLPQTSGA
eukprot:scaffold13471_cov22-Tisochrysis_lutea.AAC.3